jgi:hypothetical protein
MTESDHQTRTDLKQFDAHIPGQAEYEDAPELTDVQLRAAIVELGGRPAGPFE